MIYKALIIFNYKGNQTQKTSIINQAFMDQVLEYSIEIENSRKSKYNYSVDYYRLLD